MESAAEPEACVSDGGRAPGVPWRPEEGRGVHLGGGLGPTGAALLACPAGGGGSRSLPTGHPGSATVRLAHQQGVLLSTRSLPRAREAGEHSQALPLTAMGLRERTAAQATLPWARETSREEWWRVTRSSHRPGLSGTGGPPRRGQGPSSPAGRCSHGSTEAGAATGPHGSGRLQPFCLLTLFF